MNQSNQNNNESPAFSTVPGAHEFAGRPPPTPEDEARLKEALDKMFGGNPRDQCVPDTAAIEGMLPMDAYSAGVEVALAVHVQVVDLGQQAWASIMQAAGESAWMPPEYMMNEWVSDVCSFLRDPRPNEDQARSDNQFYTAQLQARAAKALGLDPENSSWFDVVGKLESTPSSRWKAEGEADPHAGQYDGERAALALGQLTDDELANGAFMNYDGVLDIHRILAKDPDYHSPIAWMTAVKDRIRWLSRKLDEALKK